MFVSRRPWLIAGLLVAAGAGTTSAQLRLQVGDFGQTQEQLIPQNRQLESLLDLARQQLTQPEGDRQQGLEQVQRILNEAEDHFIDRKADVSLREQAEELLAGLPDDTRRLYEQIYGGEARVLLETADGARHQRLREVVRRYFFTTAGSEAADTIAVTEMDRGQFLTAARIYQRIWTQLPTRSRPGSDPWERAVTAYWKAGFPQQSQTLLMQAADNTSGKVLWRGQPVPTFSNDAGAVDWLVQQLGAPGSSADVAVLNWLVPGGGGDRNASALESSPVFDNAWLAPLFSLSDAKTPARFDELQITANSVHAAAREEPQARTYSVQEPLGVEDIVLYSSYGRIKAVDAATGQFRWQAADADPIFEFLVQNLTTTGGGARLAGAAPMEDFLAQRAWLDTTSASLTSDGQRVYQVFDSGMVGPFSGQITSAAFSTHPLTPKPYNRLRAYDIETEGKLLWEIGGPTGRVPLPLAGTFFLGSPLPVEGSLYVLGEERGQVRLIVLDPRTGEVQWSLPLLNVAIDIQEDVERRLAGLSPAQAGGLLICPTGGGMVFAVDTVLRSLVWGHNYDPPRKMLGYPNIAVQPFPQAPLSQIDITSTTELLETPRWYGNSTLLAGQFVLHAPSDDEELYCLSLLDGELVWSLPRKRLLTVAGVQGDDVILVGERHVEAVQLSTGETIWSLPLGMPSGRGVRAGSLYHLPLQSGEVATIDLANGRLLARSSTRSGADLGSLVAAGGRLFTQSSTELRGFRSQSELERQIAADLADDPRDPAALSVRGEMRLHAGQTDNALADLRASFKAVPDERVKGLIVDTLLERLQSDFAAHQDTAEELVRLTSEPQQRIRLMRTIAEGLEVQGDISEAHANYLQMLLLDGLASTEEHVSDEHTVRLDRWVIGRLQALYQQANAEQRERLDTRIAGSVDAIIEGGDIEQLARAATAFGQQSAGRRAIQSLTDRIDPQQDPLRAEMLLLSHRNTGTPPQRVSATSRLVQLYADAGRGDLVESLLQELDTVDADVTSPDGQSGRQLAAALREIPAVTAALSNVVSWPTEAIDVRKSPERPPGQSPVPLRKVGRFDPLFVAAGFHSDNYGQVIAYDGYGRREWTSERLQSSSRFPFPQSHSVERRGHRALLSLGNQFRIVDMLRYGQPPRTILEDDLFESSREFALGRALIREQMAELGLRGQLVRDGFTNEYRGNIGPLGNDLFCYQKGETLYAIDALTGSSLWHRDNVTRGCEIFADDFYVILVAPGQRRNHMFAQVLRAADGALLGTRELPADLERQRQGADWGRMFLTRQREDQGVTLAMFDPVAGENVWERAILQYESWVPLDGHELVVLEETGRVQLIHAETGETQFETQTEISEELQSLTVVSHPHEWFLFSERSDDLRQRSGSTLPSLRQEFQFVNGFAYAFDRRTHDQLWSREILSQMIDSELPGLWPLLVLSSQAKVALPGNQAGPSIIYQNLLLLNKRTGDIVFEGDGENRWQGTTWSLSETAPQLQLSFNGTALFVSFADQPEVETENDTFPPPDQHEDQPQPVPRRTPAPPASIPPGKLED